MTDLEERCRKLIAELALAGVGDVRSVEPLTGGVASDIAAVDLGTRMICVKFALPKLKVAADWRAPVHRNAAEYAWLKVASELFPESAVRLFGHSETEHGFAMEFLEGDDVYLWKTHLLKEAAGRGEAESVADMLGRIHAASSKPEFDASPFQNHDDFQAIRIDPYLSTTRQAHPDLTPQIEPLEHLLYDSSSVLVHGDASPKNIIFRNGAPILLDAECATMGDASFDPSFCLNHIVLKAIHLPRSRERLLKELDRFWITYRRHICWEDADALLERICRLLPVLMLARVDGKSPVEYLQPNEQGLVRSIAIPLIRKPSKDLVEFSAHVLAHLEERTK